MAAGVPYRCDDVDQVAQRPAKAVELPNDKSFAGLHRSEGALEPGTVADHP